MAPVSPPDYLPYPNESNGSKILGVGCMFTILATLAVCARIYTRVKIVNSVGLDDYASVLAVSLSIVGMAVVIPEVHYGAGRHINYIKPSAMQTGIKLNFVTQPIYLWGIAIAKVSIALFLLRITPVSKYRRFLWGLIAFVLTYTLACTLAVFVSCVPLHAIWTPDIKAKRFTPFGLRSLNYTNVALSIFSDILLAILPVSMLRNLQMTRGVKVGFVLILGLGLFACTAASVRIVFIKNFGKTGDYLWDSTDMTISMLVECNVGILAASIPTISPLVKTLYDNYRPRKYSYEMDPPRKAQRRYSTTLTPVGSLEDHSTLVGSSPPDAHHDAA